MDVSSNALEFLMDIAVITAKMENPMDLDAYNRNFRLFNRFVARLVAT